MTNLLLSISFLLATNWTGHIFNGYELGYVLTNHVARVEYGGTTNQYTLQSDRGSLAVWRVPQAPDYALTNFWTPWVWTNIVFTNYLLRGL